MSAKFVVPEDTARRQLEASDPAASAWVSANAGSGKTFVLAQRVIRLLLSGAPPARLLCLTFTKAAAATMSNRVFATLAGWTAMPDADLAAELKRLGRPVSRPEDLERARRLFADAIETPGGLKIQTIHAFCEALLQRFPLEADLAGNFETLDDASAADLKASARQSVLAAAGREGDDGPLGAALVAAMASVGEAGLAHALDLMVEERDRIVAMLRAFDGVEEAMTALGHALGLKPGDSEDRLAAERLASPDFEPGFMTRWVAALQGSKASTDQKRLDAIGRARQGDGEAWLSIFLTAKSEQRTDNGGTKAIQTELPDLAERFGREAARLIGILDRQKALAAVAANRALLTLGDATIASYETAKRARGALDFSDLIARAVLLLSRSDSAAWVQYKLDQGIDHVLVDEAQDTNPDQWRIITQLTEEFFAGLSARGTSRTIFAVGDDKQSIYSFQGASPAEFSDKERQFRGRAADAGHPFRSIKLVHSFRSTQDVLSAVDITFRPPEMQAGVAPGGWQDHLAIRADAPGRVEIWPAYLREAAEEPEDWTDPIDRPAAGSPALRLASRIADEIARLTAPGSRLEGLARQVQPKDILILVRGRGAFVDAMNRVLRERGIPASGADRLDLFAHIAVRDLVALGRVMLLPDDDLTLATVLKSPLIGLDEDALFAIAARRGDATSLWDALQRAEAEDARAAARRLKDWRDRAAIQPAFAFYANVLALDGGRRAFLDRLGNEVDEVLDEFLAALVAHEQASGDGLASFLQTAETSEAPIKREIDEERDEVRVMTVHGAKGLEAPVVFLVDGGGEAHSSQHDAPVLDVPVAGGVTVPLWKPRKENMPGLAAAILETLRERQREEYRRLLYVAMTRAADRLIVACHAPARGPKPDCWYERIRVALVDDAREVTDAEGNVVAHVWRAAERPPVPGEAAPAEPPSTAAALPAWVDAPPAAMAPRFVLRPSSVDSGGLAGADRVAGSLFATKGTADERETALARGRLVHRLLDTLPELAPALRDEAAARIARRETGLAPDEAAASARLALAILADPRFAAAFAPGSRGEVPLVGELRLADGRELMVSGRVDRLAVTDDEILLIDFKTDREAPPEGSVAPEPYVGQLALYAALLKRVFPARPIRAALIWTAAARLDTIPTEALAAAERRFGILPQ